MSKIALTTPFFALLLAILPTAAQAGNYVLQCNITTWSPPAKPDGELAYHQRATVEFLGGGVVTWTAFQGSSPYAYSGSVTTSDATYAIHLPGTDPRDTGTKIAIDRQTGRLTFFANFTAAIMGEGTCHPVTVTPKM